MGTFREREELGLLPRPNYAYGMLRAADLARYLGLKQVTACEFGVATGAGLTAMIDHAADIEREAGVRFRIVGFDTGTGLPRVGGYEDHPELWAPGDFAMVNKDELTKRIEGRAELLLGDISDTVCGFVASLAREAPLGFVSVDVDIYSATCSALRCFEGPAEHYLPAISIYFDDVSFYFANRWCGELRAIDEFNRDHELRKIDIDRGLIHRGIEVPALWHSRMYVAHILDHEFRAHPVERPWMTLEDHVKFVRQFDCR
ncbi:MAG: hypothetical protein ACP5XB_12765 [Isosphaeraceae bacterium]